MAGTRNAPPRSTPASGSRTVARQPPSLIASKDVLEPRLVSLFAADTGDSKTAISSLQERQVFDPLRADDNLNAISGSSTTSDSAGTAFTDSSFPSTAATPAVNGHDVLKDTLNSVSIGPSRKRKRKEDHDELEDAYLRRVAEIEARDRRELKRKADISGSGDSVANPRYGAPSGHEGSINENSINEDESEHGGSAPEELLQHESLAVANNATEVEKSSRTVFLSNVATHAISSKAAKKTLISHLSSFLPTLPSDESDPKKHKVESLRFRSTAYASNGIPKKAAYARKELMDATTKSTNAYVVYSTAAAARGAVKALNGTVVLDRHLRVDSVAHPAKVDHKRCVFVGNLGFVDDESLLEATKDSEYLERKKRSKQPADVEEGLWRQFGNAGTVESVRVVRDPKTRVGKGFAYVQFTDANAVEAALLYHDKRFPPMLPRRLRVTRAKSMKKTAHGSKPSRDATGHVLNQHDKIYAPKTPAKVRSLQGRAGKLLGRAGAAQLVSKGTTLVGQDGQGMALEGHRATSKSAKHVSKRRGPRSRKGKPASRGTKRASAWRASGGKPSKD